MLHRFRWPLRIGLLLSAAYLLWAFVPALFGFPIVLLFGPITPSPQRYDCQQFTDYLRVRNQGLFAAPMREWWFRDRYGAYQFPDRWLMPGEEIHIWSKRGDDDPANIHAGRISPVWETTKFSFGFTYFKHKLDGGSTIFCDPF
jgi:hypothetical protein